VLCIFRNVAWHLLPRKTRKMAEEKALKELNNWKAFGGHVKKFSHQSASTHTEMKFSVYLPPQITNTKVPVIYWLSGLTCNEDNFVQKAGAFRSAAEAGVMLVCPDTSPRGVSIPGDSDSWDFGVAAGFYVNATQEKWAKNYNMYDYVTKELPALIKGNFNVNDKKSIFGHSMGGHGALICFLKNPNAYQSVSAFAPICNPSVVPWGIKAFTGYLGENKDEWKAYDACELMMKYDGPKPNILIDQGTEDSFLRSQLLPEQFQAACQKMGHPIDLRLLEGYDHSYFFISSFVEDHIKHHAKYLFA